MSSKPRRTVEDNKVELGETLPPETYKGEDYSVLEPYILQEHAGKNDDKFYRAIEEDGCPKVIVSRDREYLEGGSLSEGRIAYSSKKLPDGSTVIRMELNPKSKIGKATGSKPWNNIVEGLKEDSREREKSSIDTKALLGMLEDQDDRRMEN